MVRLLSNGDGGDAIACLPIIRQLGGGEFVFTQGKNPRPFRNIAHMLEPLFKVQPYISNVYWADKPTGISHDCCGFRPTHYRPNRTLAESQADYLGLLPLDLSPWLTVSPNPKSAGRIVISRTRRYNNPKFPWRTVFSRFKSKLLFIGLDEERHALERISGIRIEHHRVANFLDMASIIAGSDCFIGNQSSPYWLAAGMGHPLIQETENVRKIHDAKVPRPNAIYSEAGQFPAILPQKVKWEYVPSYEI